MTGNLAPVSIVRNLNPEFIRKSVEEAYEKAGNPYMINAGCEIQSRTPNENLKALCSPLTYKRR